MNLSLSLSLATGRGGGQAVVASTVASRSSAFFNGKSSTNDSYSYAKGASWGTWAFPDADWTVAMLLHGSYAAGAAAGHLLNIGSFGVNGLVALYWTGGTTYPRLNAQVRTTATTTITQAADFTPDGNWYVVGVRRAGSNIELFRCAQNGAVQVLASAALASPAAVTPNGTTVTVGARSDGNANSYYQGAVSWLLKLSGTVSDATIQSLAAGSDAMTDLGLTPDVYTKFDGSASIADSSGNGKTATRAGSPRPAGGPAFAGLPINIDSAFNTLWGKVWQRVGTSRSITFTGTFRDNPSGIECRVAKADGTDAAAWTDATLNRAAGTWACTLNVPQGGKYTLEARHKDNTAKIQRTWMPWGVGAVVLYAGQSNMVNQFVSSQTSVTPDSQQVALYTAGAWATLRAAATPTGGGALQLATRMLAALGIPVAVVNGAKTGSAVVASDPDNWSHTDSTAYQGFLTALSAAGGDAELLLWGQGEADADNSIAGATYQSALATVLANLRASVGRAAADLPVGMWMLGHRGSVEQGTWNAIRTAHRNLLGSVTNAFFLGTPIDLTLNDQLHYIDAAYETLGRRFARAVLNKLLPGSFATGVKGAEPASVAVNGTDLDVTFTLTDGTALQGLTGATGLTGFVVKNGSGVVQTISATAIPSANVVRLTPASAPAAGWTVEYLPNAIVDTTNNLFTNATVDGDSRGVPVLPTTAPLVAA